MILENLKKKQHFNRPPTERDTPPTLKNLSRRHAVWQRCFRLPSQWMTSSAWRHRRPIRIFFLFFFIVVKLPLAIGGVVRTPNYWTKIVCTCTRSVRSLNVTGGRRWRTWTNAGLFNRLRPPSKFQSATSRRSELTLTLTKKNFVNSLIILLSVCVLMIICILYW